MSTMSNRVHQRQESDIDSRIQEVYALGESGDADAFPVLVDLLNTTDDPRIRNAAAIGLRDLADNRALPFLLAQIKNPKNANYRGTLVYALETLDARSALVDLIDLIGSGDYEAAAMAIRAIETFTAPVATEKKRDAKRTLKRYLRETSSDEWRPEMLDYAKNLLNHLPTA